MYFHLLKYKFKNLFRDKEMVGWIFAFPVALGTFFFLAFGNLIGNEEYKFSPVPVAFVTTNESSNLESIMSELSKEEEGSLFRLTKTDGDSALVLLEKKEVDGIIYDTSIPTITVVKEGLNQSIMKSFLDSYLKHMQIFEEIGSNHPEKLQDAMNQFSKDLNFNEEISFSNTKMDALSVYFYALIAMTCLYGSLIGRQGVESIQANLSTLGARREVSPANKLSVILADFTGSVIFNYLSVLLLFFYLIVILKVDFGNQILLILLASFAGSVIGVSMGTFIGSIGKGSANVKDAIVSSVSLILSFLSGLMINNMKNIVEHTAPFINRMNPAALLTDCLYSLNMYDTLDRYFRNLISMGIIAVLFIFGSFMLLRRNRYASI
ncbi:MAG: ABC transporter permease [Anaerocolumna sp.]